MNRKCILKSPHSVPAIVFRPQEYYNQLRIEKNLEVTCYGNQWTTTKAANMTKVPVQRKVHS